MHGAPEERVCACRRPVRKELCSRFVKSGRLRDLVSPAVIRAVAVSRLIAECRCGEGRAPAGEAGRRRWTREPAKKGAAKGKMTELPLVISQASLWLRLRSFAFASTAMRRLRTHGHSRTRPTHAACSEGGAKQPTLGPVEPRPETNLFRDTDIIDFAQVNEN